ncbi:hypothetical protein Ancab_017190 [Ancistrocladus abbreviatus]
MQSYIEEREREVAEREAAWKAELSRREVLVIACAQMWKLDVFVHGLCIRELAVRFAPNALDLDKLLDMQQSKIFFVESLRRAVKVLTWGLGVVLEWRKGVLLEVIILSCAEYCSSGLLVFAFLIPIAIAIRIDIFPMRDAGLPAKVGIISEELSRLQAEIARQEARLKVEREKLEKEKSVLMGTASNQDNQDGALEITVGGEKYRCLRFAKAKK